MIFPILGGLLSFHKAPVTWTLVTLNLMVLLYTSAVGVGSQQGLEDVMKDTFFVATQGRVYAQYLEGRPQVEYPQYMFDMATHVREGGSAERAEVLGQLAFRDLNFLNAADRLDFSGDQVAFRLWKKKIGDVRLLQEMHPSFTMGLNAEDTSLTKWVSYIFVHSGSFHFLGNMLFLVIFGAALELQVGGLAMLVVFLLSGSFAAGVFAFLTGVTSSPLVGASGAVSGVMALYCVMNWARPARFFYWLFLPFRGYIGFVYLPAWVALVMWAINDAAGYLSTIDELGGVAHTAHLGGEVAGLITGVTVFFLRRFFPLSGALAERAERLPEARAVSLGPPMGVLIPLVVERAPSPSNDVKRRA